jgi:type III secretory pathway component EscV
MDIKQANINKEELVKEMEKLLQEYSKETGLKFGKILINSFYDQKEEGTYSIQLNIRNPF